MVLPLSWINQRSFINKFLPLRSPPSKHSQNPHNRLVRSFGQKILSGLWLAYQSRFLLIRDVLESQFTPKKYKLFGSPV